jgi:hypothetical protein
MESANSAKSGSESSPDVPAILAQLEDCEALVRKRAIQTLIRLEPAALTTHVRAILLRTTDEDDAVGNAALDALDRMDPAMLLASTEDIVKLLSEMASASCHIIKMEVPGVCAVCPRECNDEFSVECGRCRRWFHGACIFGTTEEVGGEETDEEVDSRGAEFDDDTLDIAEKCAIRRMEVISKMLRKLGPSAPDALVRELLLTRPGDSWRDIFGSQYAWETGKKTSSSVEQAVLSLALPVRARHVVAILSFVGGLFFSDVRKAAPARGAVRAGAGRSAGPL